MTNLTRHGRIEIAIARAMERLDRRRELAAGRVLEQEALRRVRWLFDVHNDLCSIYSCDGLDVDRMRDAAPARD